MKRVCLLAGLLSFAGSAMAQSISHESGFPPLADALSAEDGPWNDIRKDKDLFGTQEYAPLLAKMPAAVNKGPDWEIYKTQWSAADEEGYEAFVTAIGRSGCISIDDCLRSPANPYRDLEDETLWLGDCTDMVYVLRGYYAWKNGLPFSFQDGVMARQAKERGGDIRYTSGGNKVTSRYDVTHPSGRPARNAPDLLTGLFNIVSTAMLRTDPRDDDALFSDFYPVTISRDGVRPGVVAYDIYGHVSIVYDVLPDGRILMISSHPDYTVSRDTYGANILRTGPELGGGLKAWRPVTLVGAKKTERGTYIGGRIVGAKNSELPQFSLAQYFGTHPDSSGDWDKGRFIIDGRTLPYYDFVRAALRKPGVPFDPLEDMATATNALCSGFRARKTAVKMAIYAGIPNQPAPEKLPPNIYGTYGDWERYASPSRDARLKTEAVELREMVADLIDRAASGDESVAYVSEDLAAALLDVYDRHAEACKITYERSDGSRVRMTLHHVMDRLFDLSFDPFQCAERRWGAKGAELSTCTDTPDKTRWYEAQRWLRNDPGRTYDLRTDFRAEQLRDPARARPQEGGLGLSSPPDVDVLGYLTARAGAHALAGPDLPVKIIRGSDAVNAGGGSK
ncbi:hypothetical protein [Parvularcula sp. LCG005]|uniref:hypothetical protein n=1 Tax=Parvularcula sp. LCG005 TaxID=3078805 RepID=UPI002943B63F|nr:hypothetical protein [Parvularcula sp. LCG005]WOI52092.1 hypothetical protein RUI03_07970 [Parvularcula sp. LCG005]